MIWMKCISLSGLKGNKMLSVQMIKNRRRDRKIVPFLKSQNEGSVMKILKTLICMCAHFLSK